MSFQVEHLIYDLTQYLVLIPGGLAPPPPQGDVITTQVSRFVGETPPPSFAQFPRHPAPPSGHDVVQALGYWSFALGGIRYYVPKFDTPEPRVEPEVWSISVTRAPDSVDGPPATRPTAPVLATAASSSTLAAAAAAASSSTTTLAGAQPQLQQQQQGQRRRGSVLRWAESVGAADPVTPSRGGGAGQRESSPGVSRLAGEYAQRASGG